MNDTQNQDSSGSAEQRPTFAERLAMKLLEEVRKLEAGRLRRNEMEMTKFQEWIENAAQLPSTGSKPQRGANER